jgi:uncharacterized cofD-like protein
VQLQHRVLRSPSPPCQPFPAGGLNGAPRIVAIGGGTGLPCVLSGLRTLLAHRGQSGADLDSLTAIVTVTDDGGHSGWVRRELGTLPPGDVRNCLAALADGSPLARLLQHRFPDGREFAGHSVGNLMLAGLAQITGDFAQAVNQMEQLLTTHGRVLPSTQESICLRAEFESGDVIDGETAIAGRHGRIRRLSLERPVRPLPDALRALINADGIVVGPGSLYTSVLPNLLVGGIAPTIASVNGVRIYVANLMTEPGETDHFSLDDHLRVIYDHVGAHLFDYVLVNRRQLTPSRAVEQAQRGAHPIAASVPLEFGGQAEVANGDFLSELPGGDVRHAAGDLAAAILRLVGLGRPDREGRSSGERQTEVFSVGVVDMPGGR